MTKAKHDEIVNQLDKFYLQAKRQILQNQSAITGLFPSNSAESSDASIKTSLWAASSIFALYLAYSKRVDNDQGKAHDLGQSVVKCMRGILFAWMRQSEKVESFKANQCPKHALHLKFDLHSGLANDFDYPHLQIDVVSLYLIFLANFIASGLDIIYCMDEVTFIQNLVYYVERAYRTPDYGNWEPQQPQQQTLQFSDLPQTTSTQDNNNVAPVATAINYSQHQSATQMKIPSSSPPQAHQLHGYGSNLNATTSNNRFQHQQQLQQISTQCINCASNHENQSLEIHATSIGMAKSALEAINGCNLFGGKGANWSIIYSDIDAHSRNRSIFETLLPRESRSKNTDSHLLATISWPCFATNDTALYNSTKSKILRKLKGKYGLKRFLRDPYGTVLNVQQQQQQQSALSSSTSLTTMMNISNSFHDNQIPRDASFNSNTSLASSLGSESQQLLSSSSSSLSSSLMPQQPKVKLRKSSYFQRKNPILSTGAGASQASSMGMTSTISIDAATTQPTAAASSSSLQRTESTSARMSKRFEHIESEWPLFICFLIIDGIFKQNLEQVSENEKLLYEKLLKIDPIFNDYLMPKYYYVPMELINNEKCHPDSVERVASLEGSSSDRLYLTGQSILLITRLLLAGLVHPNELDPLRRHQPAHDRPKRTIGRYSSFQATSPDLVVQTVLIAESIRLQAMMANYGIQTQTPREVEPVQIWSSAQLVKVYEYLGVNQKLGLKGRPARPIGALGTSKLYRICGQTIICYPLIFEVSDFYLAQDMLLLIDDIQNELNFIGRYWRMSGRPTVCIIIREEHLKDVHFRDLLNLLVQFKNGQLKKSGLRIKTGRLQNLISSSCIEHLDFLHLLPHEHLPQFESFRQLVESPKQSLLLAQRQKATHNRRSVRYPTEIADCEVANNSGEQQQRPEQQVASTSNSSGQDQRQQPPNKSRRVLLCSASSNNLQASSSNNTGEQLDYSFDAGDGEDFHSMLWDDHNNAATTTTTATNRTISSINAENSSDDEYLSFGSATIDNQQQQQPQQTTTTTTTTTTTAAKVKDYYDCYKEAPTWPTLIELLRTCQELSGQSQLLAILWEREGAKYCVDEQSVEQRLERLSQIACQQRNWSVVRYCSAVLKRSVESLSPWLTSILVNGKQISLGQGQNEIIINNPLTPTEIHTLIYSTVSTMNPCDAVLQQEIALYIGRLISTRPDYFEGILTIRVANFMSAMRSYLNIKNNERKLRLIEKQRQQKQQKASSNDATGNQQNEQNGQQQQQQQQLLDLRIKHEQNDNTTFTASTSASASEWQSMSVDDTRPLGPPQPSIVQPEIKLVKCETMSDEHVNANLVRKSNKRPAFSASHQQHWQRSQQQQHHQQQQSSPMARPLESLSPSEVRRLLVRVLTDDQSLPISDRRQITGELCRVPRDFYDKVWSLLHYTNVGIVIGRRMLRSIPILTNMTQDDLNFALKVESILSSIDCPKLRQINVEFLMALHVVFERNPELRFDTEPLDLDKIIQLSLEKFRHDNERDDFGLQEFYCMTNQMAMLYSVRTVFDCLLPTKYKGRDDLHFM